MDLAVMAVIGYLGFMFYQNKKFSEKESFNEPFIFQKVVSYDGDHFLEKKNNLFFLGYDNHKDLTMWVFTLPTSISEQKLTEMFFAKTSKSSSSLDFYKWLNEQGIEMKKHNWY